MIMTDLAFFKIISVCGKRYKNQQGLRYHYEHHHDADPDAQTPAPSSQVATTQLDTPRVAAQTVSVSVEQPPADHVTGAKRKKGMPPSSYCDFCLGNTEVNKKSGSSGELISCADCGHSDRQCFVIFILTHFMPLVSFYAL